MPKGATEGYRILLKTDRSQRKALDAFLDRVNKLAFEVFQEQRQNIEVGAPLKPEELADKFAATYPDLDRETVRDAVDRGIEIMVGVLGGAIRERRRPTRLFAVDPKSVTFAMSEQAVRIPHVGVCGFKANPKGLAALEGTNGYVSRHAFHSAVVGYWSNEPVLILEV